jgi:hypothetical protein
VEVFARDEVNEVMSRFPQQTLVIPEKISPSPTPTI